MSQTAPSTSPTKLSMRGAVAVASVVSIIAAVQLFGPSLYRWRQERFSRQLAQRAAAESNDRRAKAIVAELGGLGPASIEPLVELAAGEKAATAEAAQRALILLVSHWDALLDDDGRPEAELAEPMIALTTALANRGERFGPRGGQWARQTVMQLLAHVDRLDPDEAIRMLNACDRALHALPTPTPTPARLRDVALVDRSAPKPLAAIAINAAELAAAGQRIAAERRASASPRPSLTERTERAEQREQDSSPTSPALPETSQRRRLAWQPNRRPAATVQPAVTPTRDGDSGRLDLPGELTAADGAAIDVPSPMRARWLRREYRALSTEELTAALDEANRYHAAIIQAALAERANGAPGEADKSDRLVQRGDR